MPDNLAKLWSELGAAPSDGATPVSTEARIVAAALELFAEHSYEAATTQAIAKRAGVTERTLFKHFKNKETLFAKTVYPALLNLIRPVAMAELSRVLQEHPGDFRATVRAIVAERLQFALKHPTIVKLVAQEVLLRPAFRKAAFEFIGAQLGPSLEALFTEARASGQMRDVPTRDALRTIVANVIGYVLSRLVLFPDETTDVQQDIETISTLVLDGLALP